MSDADPYASNDSTPRAPLKLGTAKFEAVNTPSSDTPPPTDVHEVLRENLRREQAAGMYDIPPPRRRSRRRLDYWLVLIAGNLAITAFIYLTRANAITVVFGVSGIVLFSAGLTWIMWVLMDDY
jgi:hypothetical protein